MIFFLGGLLVLAAVVIALRRRAKRLPLPPGPPSLPLIGNLHQLGGSSRRDIYRDWQKKYGSIFSAKLGSRPIIFLAKHSMAKELLEKRGRIYSSRPNMVAAENMTRNMDTAMLPYGPKWQTHTRLLGSLLNVGAVRKSQIIHDVESKQLVRDLLYTNDFSRCFYRFTSSLIFMSSYGQRLTRGDEPEIKILDTLAREALGQIGAGAFAVETFPILNLLPPPFAPWKRLGDQYFNMSNDAYESFATAAEKTDSWNWTVHALSAKESEGMTRQEVIHMIGTLFAAGGTSTRWTLEVFVMACVLYPDAVRRAQLELDEVVGVNRLPTIDDKDNLPYITAFMNEVLRWRPVVSEGVAHTVTEDDEYMGYRIPRGSSVYPNNWAIEMDENVFKNPETFDPDRWIENPDLPLSAFGFGRRLCPGMHFARNSLYISMVRLLWTYDFDHAYKDGRKINIDPWNMKQEGALITVNPFPADLRERDKHRKEVVEREWQNTEKDPKHLMDQVRASRSN